MKTFYKKIIKIYKLTALYLFRIIFVKNNLNPTFIQKLKANFSRGFLADQWVLYDFDHNDKKEYLSEFDWYRSRYINDPFNFMLNNKIVATEILQQYVTVAPSYVIKSKGMITDFNSNQIEYMDIVNLIYEKEKVFIKPYGAGKGKGVFILVAKGEQLYIDNTPVTMDQMIHFLSERDNWFLSKALVQGTYANNLYDQTSNTIRLITLRDIHTQKFKVFFAVQRIGTKETIPVDNGSRGGLVSKIDLDTGLLSEARCLHSLDVHTFHPDSKAPIKGVQVPNWRNIKEQILDLARKFPYMHFIAWDILLTDEGISIVEANTSSGVNIIQLWGGQRNNELGDFYRYHKVIR